MQGYRNTNTCHHPGLADCIIPGWWSTNCHLPHNLHLLRGKKKQQQKTHTHKKKINNKPQTNKTSKQNYLVASIPWDLAKLCMWQDPEQQKGPSTAENEIAYNYFCFSKNFALSQSHLCAALEYTSYFPCLRIHQGETG